MSQLYPNVYPSVEAMNQGEMEIAQGQPVSTYMDETFSYNSSVATGTAVAPAAAPLAVESPYSGYVSYRSPEGAVAARTASVGTVAVPVSQAAHNYQKAKIHEGVQIITIIPNQHNKLGFKVKSVSKGVFVQCVINGLPAAAAGLRFGDQILSINDVNVAGMKSNKAHDLAVAGGKAGKVQLSVRQRPFERTIVLKKDSTGHFGFDFHKNLITGIRKESSAARNGLLTDHVFTEVNGQNVVGVRGQTVKDIMTAGGDTMTMTIVPKPMYDIMIKNLASKTKELMDHSIPEL